jgi:proline dehydrogenase
VVSTWQKFFIWLARSAFLKHLLEGNRRLSRIAARFVGGPDAACASNTPQALRDRNMRASLFYLGEYVTDRETVVRTIESQEQIIEALGSEGLDVHVSVDPTQIGYSIDDQFGEENAVRLGTRLLAAASTPRSYLMLDMEDSSLTGRTIALCRLLNNRGIPAAITLQAYLKRTESDARTLLRDRVPSIRLVKGAFAEGRTCAWTRRAEIDASYLRLTSLLFSEEAREYGLFAVFATHDHNLICSIIEVARARGYQPGQYEFEMLYGVRPDLQKQLVTQGEQLRLYVPLGKDWWPYTARRIGESPRNATLLLRALIG